MMQRKDIRHTIRHRIREDSEHYELIYDLEWWFNVFNIVFFSRSLTTPTITVESTRVTNLASLQTDTIIGTVININPIHLNREYWDTLSSLLHETIHLSFGPQNEQKATWYHNKAFIEKAAECGLHVGQAGEHIFVTDPFISLLTKHGVQFGFIKQSEKGTIAPQPDTPRPKGKSKLIHWSCGCTNVRVAIRYFKAKCLKCGNDFRKID